ncbi:MAG: hypothetical protein R3301_05150 [Saprospiraceae bacterium]|nr:hypothetical protein [Saprospiraceae bacterium]
MADNRDQFVEVQHFYQQPLVWVVWLIFAMLVYYLMAQGLIFDTVGYLVIALALGANLFIFVMRLETRVDRAGVHYRMWPFHRSFRHLSWEEIQQAEVRAYRPLREYGGYGIRIGLQGKAYNVKGKMGLQLVLRNGKRILIGTQEADLLAEVLHRVQPARTRT